MRTPLVRQTSPHNCGEAVVESLLRHYHEPVGRSHRFSSEVDGTAPRTIECFLRKQGFSVVSGNFNWALLKHYVARRLPVIVCRDGHWSVVCDIECRSVWLMDPLHDDYVKESIVRFKRTWNDWDSMATEYRSWAIAASPYIY